jgi:hypothetical protein
MIKKRVNKANSRRNRSTTDEDITPAQEAKDIVDSAVKKSIKAKPSFLSFEDNEENEPVLIPKKYANARSFTVT